MPRATCTRLLVTSPVEDVGEAVGVVDGVVGRGALSIAAQVVCMREHEQV